MYIRGNSRDSGFPAQTVRFSSVRKWRQPSVCVHNYVRPWLLDTSRTRKAARAHVRRIRRGDRGQPGDRLHPFM